MCNTTGYYRWFIGKTAWLLYSGNYATDWNGEQIIENPPGSHYGMVFQKIELLTK